MKRFFQTLLLVSVFNYHTSAQLFQKSFDEPSPLDEWFSNDKSNWQIVNTSGLAGGAPNSKTLKLNTQIGGGEQYLSIQNTGNWGNEQTWSFWIGRDAQSFTFDNKCYIWLWADRADLKDPEINGYRVRIGDDSRNGDDLILEKVIAGRVQLLVSNGQEPNNVIPNGLLNYGLAVQIYRTKNSNWGIYTSATPTSNGGANALTDPSIANTPFDRNPVVVIMHDDTFTNFEKGFCGITAIHSQGLAARTGLEFDQFKFTNEVHYQEYQWNGQRNDYRNPDAWNPSRNFTRMTDVLNFSSKADVDNLRSEVISSINVANSSSVTFRNSESVAVNVLGDAGPALKINNTSNLTISSDFPFNMIFPVGAKGEIEGTLTVSQDQATVAHQISISDERALVVRGSIVQNCNANLFGTSTKSANNVVFTSGSSFVSRSGGNPFGLTAPLSKVIFEDGSTYVHEQNGFLPTNDRQFANFELKGNGSVPSLVDHTLEVDDFTISSGSLIINNSVPSFKLIVRGNLAIAPVSNLSINGSSTIEMIGTGMSIFGGNRIVSALTSAFKISNDILLQDPMTITGRLILQEGVLNLNGQSLTLSPNSTIQKISGSLSSAPEANSEINYIYGDGTENVPQIETGSELQESVRSISINNPKGVRLKKAASISGALDLQKGKLISDVANFLTLSSSASLSSSFEDSFVEGPIAKSVNSTQEFKFPIGAGNKTHPLTIMPTSGTNTTFKATYFNAKPSLEILSQDLKTVSKVEYWTLEKDRDGKARVKLAWDENSGINQSQTNDLRVAWFNGDSWVDAGKAEIGEAYIVSNELESFGLLSFGSFNDAMFPVVFRSFTAKLKNGIVELTWTTALEHDNKGFEVERSVNGIDFVKIGYVSPQEDNLQGADYSFIDYDFSQTSYYRLKQIDFNEQFEYSDVIVVKTIPKDAFSISPNPSSSTVKLSGPFSDRNDLVYLYISNLQGLELSTFSGNLETINRKLNEFLENSSDGLYLLTITEKGHHDVIKFFKGK